MSKPTKHIDTGNMELEGTLTNSYVAEPGFERWLSYLTMYEINPIASLEDFIARTDGMTQQAGRILSNALSPHIFNSLFGSEASSVVHQNYTHIGGCLDLSIHSKGILQPVTQKMRLPSSTWSLYWTQETDIITPKASSVFYERKACLEDYNSDYQFFRDARELHTFSEYDHPLEVRLTTTPQELRSCLLGVTKEVQVEVVII